MPPTDTAPWIARLIDEVTPAVRTRLALDTAMTIVSEFGIDVSLVPDTGEDCTIHGAYFGDRRTIAVTATASSGRIRFSLLHELSHHLINTGPYHDLLLDPESARLEEAVCDGFAAAILLPDDLIDEHIASDGPTAGAVADLWMASTASRAAACVAGASRLQSSGYVMLCDLSATALFTAPHGTPFRVRPDTPQGPGSMAAKAVDLNGSAHGQTTVRFASGNESPSMHGDAIVVGNYVFVVLATTRPGAVFTATVPTSGMRRSRPCLRCGEPFVPWDNLVCSRCHTPKCPHCERCDCPHRETQERVCSTCGLVKPEHLMHDGVCVDCR